MPADVLYCLLLPLSMMYCSVRPVMALRAPVRALSVRQVGCSKGSSTHASPLPEQLKKGLFYA